MISFVLGIIMLVAGVWIVWFKLSNDKSINDAGMGKYLAISSSFVVAGILLMISDINPQRMLYKLVGLFLFAAGMFFSFGFPDMKDYHPADFDYLPFILGFIVMSIGIYLVLFY